MSTLGPSLQQGMKWLVVSTPLLAKESEDKVMEAYVTNLVLDHVRKTVIPRAGTAEIPSTFESMGVKLQTKQGVESEFIFA